MMSKVRPPWWLVALLVLLAFSFQGTRGIWEPDEGRYSAVGINMLESGDWLVPTADGEHPHLTKPPITYWSLAASFGLLGMNEWAARLPGALAFIGTGLFVFGLGRRLCPARPWLPALVYALSLVPFISANVVSTDVLLAFFETAAMFAFVEAWYRGDEQDRRWIRLMWLAWALAFMTKGPPGLLPLLAAVLLLAWQDRPMLRRMFDPVGLLLFVLAGFSWYAILVTQDPGRLDYFLGYEVFDRIFTGTHARNEQWYGSIEMYLPVLVVGTLPWWALAVRAAGGPRRAWSALRARVSVRDRDWLLLLAWFIVPLTVFMLAQSRLHLYVLPLFVPLSIMFARPLARWPWLTERRLVRLATVTATVLLVLKGVAAHWPNDRDAREMARAIEAVLDPREIDEVAFVDMQPFYGLSLYLDVHTEAIRLDKQKPALSRYVPEEDICAEIAEREANVYALKENRSARFIAGVRRCTGHDPELLGDFMADDNRIVLYTVTAAPTS